MDQSIPEQMLYSTVKITSVVNGGTTGSGTGFLFACGLPDGQNFILLVTNKHVIKGATHIAASFHLEKDGKPSGEHEPVLITLHDRIVVNHPNQDVDLCGISIAGLYVEAQKRGKPYFWINLDETTIPKTNEWAIFDAIEHVTMVGYPRGLSDEKNNLPIFRRGITATPMSRDYNGKKEFMVDMACFPGSSGSPVFQYEAGMYFDRVKKSWIAGHRFKLVGVLYSGPLIQNDGRIVFGNDPRVEVAAMMHLGNVLKSDLVLDLKAEALRRAGLPAV